MWNQDRFFVGMGFFPGVGNLKIEKLFWFCYRFPDEIYMAIVPGNDRKEKDDEKSNYIGRFCVDTAF